MEYTGDMIPETIAKGTLSGANLWLTSNHPKKVSKYPLVICYIAIENGHYSWVNPLCLCPFSIAT